ncbi:P-loop containing nucleoside triphosphate hydrolase protein [Hyaloraphidium curvatum]|nr:P-loop containing nucleoside triphosphate hydrolase protein [Hyaloraphidium curvatum]
MRGDAKDDAPAKPEPSPANGAGPNGRQSDPMDVDGPVEEDPLDAFMVDVSAEMKKLVQDGSGPARPQDTLLEEDEGAVGEAVLKIDEDDEDNPAGDNEEDILALAAKAKLAKKKDLAVVDHASQKYEPFRKDFWVEPPELAQMAQEEVDIARAELDGIKIRGVDCPKPARKWTQLGLPPGGMEVIRRVLKYEKPSPIQSQAIPAIMSGRDVIGVAKTGSGKTIAFLLPMFRHIKDQRPLAAGEGPIALIMTPTRELALQIHKDCRHFARIMGLRSVCAYGGSPIKDQIADMKRGAEIVVCTPGRMIDLLCANSGRVTNLKRVTYLVLDEADRMFDMGFEPQVMKIVNNIRPDRQTVLFSATFPRQMEALARKILTKPLEITVGGRSTVAPEVTQIVEVLPEEAKFLRLLKILGNWENDGNEEQRALIFVEKQEKSDKLLGDLMHHGYSPLSIHGGKDQMDRDSTIADFKTGVTKILIATSVAARGLDVKSLNLVVNFDTPNHMEDYVHRVGRTGRAGNKGTAYTFISPDQEKYAVDIVKALKMSGTHVPEDLQALADGFIAKVKAGNAKFHGSGYGGKGLDKLDQQRDIQKKVEKKLHGADAGEEEEEEPEALEAEAKKLAGVAVPEPEAPKPAAEAAAVSALPKGAVSDAIRAAQEKAAAINAALGLGKPPASNIINQINLKFRTDGGANQGPALPSASPYSLEIEINDYPQKARWKVTNKEQMSQIVEMTGAAITTRGTFFPKGKEPDASKGEKKLFLFVEGETELIVDHARSEILRVIKEATLAAAEAEAQGGRYSVV